MPLIIGLGSDFRLKDPLGLYKDAPGLGGTEPKAASSPVKSPNADPALPAGMRNNNPGNIKYRSDVPWNGLVGPSENTDQGDPQAVFESPELGMRAAYKLARNKYNAGQKTAMDIIAGDNGWTPGNRQAAINIARTMGIDPTADLMLDDPDQASKFLRALVTQEHGQASQAYADDMIAGVVSNTSKEMGSDAVAAVNAFANPSSGEKIPERVPGDPSAKGLARLAPPQQSTSAADFLKTRLVGHGADHIDGMQPELQDRLAYMMESAPPEIAADLGIFSGARSVQRQTELWNAALKKYGSVAEARKWVAPPPGVAGSKGSQHNHGRAADLSYKGKSLKNAPQNVLNWVHENAEKFGLSFPLANEPWHIEVAEARGGKAQVTPPRRESGVITLDESFKPTDSLGLYAGGDNPFAQAVTTPAATDPAKPAEQFGPPRSQVDQLFNSLEAKEPGRYKIIEAGQVENWRAEWEKGQSNQFMKGLKGALVDQNPELLGNAMDAIGVLTDNTTVRDIAGTVSDWAKTGSFTRQPRVGGVSNIRTDSIGNFINDATDYAAYSLGSSLGSMAPGLAIGAGAAATTSNPLVGFIAGAAGPSYVQNLGDVYGALRDDPNIQKRIAAGELTEKQIAGWAAAAAVPMAALDSFGLGKVANLGGSEVKGSIIRRIATGIAKGMLTEGTTEGLQQVVSEGVQEALGADKTLADQALAVADNAIGGALGGGAVSGATSVRGRPKGPTVAVEPEQASPTPAPTPAPAPSPVQRQTYVVNDGPIDNLPAGELHGQTVQASADQSNVPTNMVRVETADGQSRIIGNQLLVPQAPKKRGPLVKALQEGQRRAAEAAGAIAPGDVAPAPVPADEPALAGNGVQVGATVRVDADGIPPFMAHIDSIEGDEVVVADPATGEIYQIPVSQVTPIAPPLGREQIETTTDTDSLPTFDEVPPAEPMAGELTSEMPSRDEQKPALEAFPGPPEPGQRVIVDSEGIERFTGRVERYETVDGKTEAVVTNDAGTSMQVPVEDLYVSKLTKAEVEAEEQRRNPPVEREKRPAGGLDRKVGDKTVIMPDELHARLYDLAKTRVTSRILDGASNLDMDRVSPAEQQKLADAFNVTPQALGQLADDYRYRVERAGKQARSQLPVKMHPLNERLLKQRQADRRKQDAEAPAPVADDLSDWWDGELTPAGRKEVLARAGVKRSEKMLWRHMSPAIKTKLAAQRGENVQNVQNVQNDHFAGKMVDAAVHEAATSPQNDLPEPTQAQKEAGNYKVGHVRLGGLDISIENPEGSERKGTDASGKAWSVKMKSHYGYIRGTVGRDKDHIDTFIKAGTAEISDDAPVFVVDQVHDGKFDEHKVMMGFGDEAEARAAYLANYTKGWKGLGNITATTLNDFKSWLAEGNTTRPFAKDRVERGRPTKRPLVEAENTFTEIQQRASDTYSRIWDDAQAKPTEMSRTAEWGRQLAQSIINPDRSHPVTEQANPLGLKIGDPVSIDGKPMYVLSIATHGGKGHEVQQVKAGGTNGYPVWYDLDRVDTPDGKGKPAKTVAETVAEARQDAPTKQKKDQAAESHSETEDDVLNRMAERHSVKSFIEMLTNSPRKQIAGVIDLKGRIWEITGSSMREIHPDAGGHGHLWAELRGAGLYPDPNFTGIPYGQITRYGTHMGLGFVAAEQPTDRQISTLHALKGAAERAGISIALDDRVSSLVNKGKSADQTASQLVVDNKKDWGSGNTLVTRDRADEVRKKLREKLRGQISAGIDPEILALGAELAAFHIEAGARRFADFAKAVAGDMGTSVEKLRPFLRAWYNGARDMLEDSGQDIAGTDDADAVRAALATLKEEGQSNEPAKLERPSEGSLERIPAEAVQVPAGSRKAGRGARVGSEPDLFGSEPARAERVPAGRGVPDGQGELPVSADGRPAGEAGDVADARNGEGDGKRPALDADRVEYPTSVATPAAKRAVDYTLTDADELGAGGQKTKFKNNVAAIRLLRTLEAGNRPATRDEQSVLAKWVGWGGLRQAFAREDGSVANGWAKEAAELKELLTPEEYRAAESSTRNAHYTSPQVVSAMWDIARRLGFRGGQVLEPSVGAGNFLGLMPGRWRDAARVTGVDLDHITGGIAKNLYPHANIQAPVGFQNFAVPDGHFDLAIGNPPFGSERLYDPERRGLNKFSIHNFFFAKSIDALKPNGVLAMVVTNYFLDASDARARAYIAARADLLGAIRLPNNAFLKNAGTEVTTDIIVLRKRAEGAPAADLSWVDVATWKDKEGREVPLNRYFKKHPDMMLGEFGAYGTMYRGDEAALVSREDDDLPTLLRSAILAMPENVMDPPGTIATERVTVPDTVADAQVGSVFLSDNGDVYRRLPDSLGNPQAEGVSFPNDTAKERVAGMIRVRDAFARLRRAQIDERATDEKIANLRKLLNERYDAFTRKHGPINADVNRRLFRDDPTWPQISALEEGFDKGISAAVAKTTGEAARPASARKAPIFSKRTQQPYRRPTSASSAKDALATVLADLGRVDLDAMSRLYRKTPQQIIDELGPLLYRTPSGAYETADQYLSGNVKAKLAEAQRAVQQDPEFRRNVAALQDVIPADIEPVDIDVKPGAPWLPPAHVAAFVEHIAGRGGARATYSRATAKWSLTVPASDAATSVQWSTDRSSMATILEAAMNGQTVSVYDRFSDGKTVLNQPATDAANEKVNKVKAEWQRWLWDDDARRNELSRLYNDTFNTDVLRSFDGSHLVLPGKVGDDIIALRPHQKHFVWRVMQSSTALADHVVGAGKTFSAIAAVMEMRRTGQARKPMMAVPNHLVGQWGADFVKLYPGAKVLAATKKDFEAENRKRLFARIATGDWDAVIVAHSSFGKIGISPEFEEKFIRDQIADLEVSERELREEEGKKTRNVAQIAKWRENLESKLKRLLDAGGKDEGLTFDELGVDALFVDEAHEFKNLAFATSQTRVAGLGNPTGSQKAADLYMKVLSVQERTGGRNIVFLTGTPLSNTMAEMYTMQRYLDGKGLRDLGVSHFDAWARVFGEIVSDWELSPSGQYKLKSRFAKFTNMPELMQRYRSFADVITNDDIKAQLAAIGKKLPLPKVKGGKPNNVVVERSGDQATYIGVGKTDENGNLVFPAGSLVYRAEHLPKKAEKGADNMLKVMSDARKAALDMRLIDPAYPDVPGSKVHVAADNIKRLYDAWNAHRGTQLVFIDLSTPKKAKAKEQARLLDLMKRASEGDEAAMEAVDNLSPDEFLALDSTFSVYDDLREKLIERGVPANEIAFIHDANTDAQKEELFGKVRSGRVRILFGSTPKMGAGTNVQNRLVALHHLDAPWRPSDLEQRDGRGIRQGNELYAEDPDGFELEILRYATKNTLDARQWQTIEGKARFIQQVRKGGISSRSIEDIAGEAANAAEMKAAASGNPLILEEMDLRQKVRRLEGQESEHDREQYRIRDRIRSLHSEADKIADTTDAAAQDAESARKASGAEFAATILGEKLDKPKDFGAAILAEARRMKDAKQPEATLGSYGDFKLSIEHQHGSSYAVTVSGARDYDVYIEDVKDADPVGTGMRVVNTVRRMIDEPAQMAERTAEIERQIPALEKQIGPWPDMSTLVETRERHSAVLAELRPKQQQPAAAVPPAGAEASIAEEPVAKLTGDELGVAFSGPEDMPALRTAARQWYDANLRSSVVYMQDGTEVRFNRRGRDKSTYGGKGDILLRAVPAIKAIIENGQVVLRQPGDRQHVKERLIIAAPVTLADVTYDLAVSVHRTEDGHLQYDFTFDSGERAGGPGSGTRLAGDASIADSLESAANSAESPRITRGGPVETTVPGSLDATPGNLNLFLWHPENKAPDGWDMVDAMDVTSLTDAERQEITDIVRKVSGLDDVAFTQRIDLPNGAPGWGTDTPTTAGGFYDPAADAITVALDSGSPHVAYHEAFHRLQRLFLTDKERAVLRAETGRLRRIVAGRMGREAQAGKMSQKELEAEAFGIYAAGTGKIQPHTALRAAWDRIAKAIRQIRNLLAGRGFQTTEDVFKRAADGEISERAADTAVGSKREYSIAPAARSLPHGRVIEELRGKLTDLQPKVLAAIPLNYFTELARPNMVAVGEYLRAKRMLDAYRGKKHADADAIAQEWLKYARLGLGKDGKAKAVELADLMHAATLAGVDPSLTDEETMNKPAYEGLRRRFTSLAPKGRELFINVRDAYSRQADELDKILLDNVRKAQEIARQKAEDHYKKEIARINAANMTKQAKKDALSEAEADYKAQSTKALWSMKARLTKMRIAFESSRVEGPYFPLARFGRYFVTVRDVDGSVLSFSRREKAADGDRLAADMRAAYPGATVEIGVMDNTTELRQAMDPRLVAEMETIVGGAGLDSTTMTMVLDQIWQRYLTTMPDLSTRKRFIHRKGTSGFESDALRAFGSHMFHAAHQMGRLKYGLELQELTNQAAEQARESDDVTRGMTLANELRLRHKWVMNPTGSAVAQVMTSAAFVWYLGATPAAAIVNISQTPMIGIPVLAGRFGGFAKAASAILRASFDTFRGKGSVTGANLTAGERAAMEAFYESGLIDRTQSHDIAGVGETGVDYSPLKAKAMAVVSWAFHRAEVWNREVTALAAYRMAKAAGQNDTSAIDTAHDLTWKTHFDYSNASRPRLMQNDFAKVALVFRAYNINMLYRVFRDIHQAFKGESKQARREARYQAAGVLGMMSLMAGVTGTVGFNVGMMIAGALLGDDDDPMDFEEHFRKSVLDILGPELGGVVLNGAPGHYLGINLSDRIGMPDLWFRSPTKDLQGKDEFDYYIMNSLGASVSMLGDAYKGFDLIRDGNTVKGVETIAPKWIRDLMRSYRYLNEGVTNLRGDSIIDPANIDAWDAIAQAIGFTPAKVSETYDRNSALMNAESRVQKRRSTLVNRFALASRMGDEDGRAAAMVAIKTFNTSALGKTMPITAETLRRSLAVRKRNADKREDGVLIENRQLGRRLREMLPEPVYR